MQQSQDAHNMELCGMQETYEGCFVADTLIRIEGVNHKFCEYVNIEALVEYGWNNIHIDVDTLGATVPATVFFGGKQECTRIDWEGGHFEGSNHPIMVLREDGNLEWKHIEHVAVGNVVMECH